MPSALLTAACSISAFLHQPRHKATQCPVPGGDMSPLGHYPVPWHTPLLSFRYVGANPV